MEPGPKPSKTRILVLLGFGPIDHKRPGTCGSVVVVAAIVVVAAVGQYYLVLYRSVQ